MAKKKHIIVSVLVVLLITSLTFIPFLGRLLPLPENHRDVKETAQVVRKPSKTMKKAVSAKIRKLDESYLLEKFAAIHREKDIEKKVLALNSLGVDLEFSRLYCAANGQHPSETAFFCDFVFNWSLCSLTDCVRCLSFYNRNHEFDEIIIGLLRKLKSNFIKDKVDWRTFYRYLKKEFPDGKLKTAMIDVLVSRKYSGRKDWEIQTYFCPEGAYEVMENELRTLKAYKVFSYSKIMAELCRSAPVKALELLNEHDFDSHETKDKLIYGIIKRIVDDDSEVASFHPLTELDLAILSRLSGMISEEKYRNSSECLLIKALTNLDKSQNLNQILSSLSERQQKETFLENMAKHIAQGEQVKLFEFCDRFLEFSPVQCDFFKCRLLLAMKNPELEYIARKIRSTFDQHGFPRQDEDSRLYFQSLGTMQKLSRQWSDSDPAATLDWLRAIPGLPEKQCRHFMDEIINKWGVKDPKAADDYVSSNP